MSFADFYAGTSGLGDAYSKGLDDYRKKSLIAQLGEQLQSGDYSSAARSAFSAGDATTGMGILRLGQDQAGRQSWANDLNTLAGLGGGGASGAMPGGGSGQGSSSPGGIMPRAPSFSDAGGGSGSYLSTVFRRESGGDPTAQNPNSSAQGLGQFTTATWRQTAQNHPDLGLTPGGRTDPEQAAKATAALAQDNAQVLSKWGIPITDSALYTAHVMGAGGAVRLIKGAANNPDAPATAFAKPDQVAANRSIFFDRDGSPKSAGQVLAFLSQGFGGGPSVPTPGGAPNAGAAQVASADPGFVPQNSGSRFPPSSRTPPGSEISSNQQLGTTSPAGSADGAPMLPAPSAPSQGMTLPAIAGGPAAPQAPVAPSIASADPEVSVPGYSGTWTKAKVAAAQRANADEYPEPNELAAAQARAGGVGGAVAQAAPAQLAQAGVPQATVQAYAGAAPGSQQRLNILMRLALNPSAPPGAAAFFKDMYAREAKASEAPDSVREWQWARMNGLTTAANPNAYAQEKNAKGDFTDLSADQVAAAGFAPGTVAQRGPDGQIAVRQKPQADRGPVSQVQARAQAAQSQGLQPGTPAFQSYVLTGKLPGDDGPGPTAQKMISDTEKSRDKLGLAVEALQKAQALNQGANGGIYSGASAGWRAAYDRNAPSWAPGANPQVGANTTEFDNLVQGAALGALKDYFGGRVTNYEDQQFTALQPTSGKSPQERAAILGNLLQRYSTLAQHEDAKLSALRGGTFFRPQQDQGQRQAPAQAMPSQSAVEAEMRRRGLMP